MTHFFPTIAFHRPLVFVERKPATLVCFVYLLHQLGQLEPSCFCLMHPPMAMNYQDFLRLHQTQLESLEVPKIFWAVLYDRITSPDGFFASGEAFRIEKLDYEGEEEDAEANNARAGSGENDNPLENCDYRVMFIGEWTGPTDPNGIFLIDHMWTFELQKRNYSLKQNEQLVARLFNLIGFKRRYLDATLERKIDMINDHLFKYCNSYLENFEGMEPQTYWYVMDEFGSRLPHSFEPNFRCVSFIFYPSCVGYSLLFPIEDIHPGDEVSINCIHPHTMQKDADLALALRIPWEPVSMTHIDAKQMEKESQFIFRYSPQAMTPDLSLGDRSKTLVDKETPLKVYAEYRYVNQYLTHPRFQLINNESDADILWYFTKFTDYSSLTRKDNFVYVSQFPYENVLTVKDLFAVVGRRARKAINPAEGDSVMAPTSSLDDLDVYEPAWLMPTYDLQSELPQFVSLYQQRLARGLNNHWIVKPWNLSRSLESIVTKSLEEIIKLRNALPKVVSKYIERPVLFHRDDLKVDVKFDLRFVVLLKRVKPLELAVYSPFWIRFANVAFSLDDVYNYEKHFTVMNYGDNALNIKQMRWQEFVIDFNSQYGKKRWTGVESEVHAALRQLFEAATSKPPPCGIAQCFNSRSMFGVDVMLRWSNDDHIQPVVLEVNWMPDCKRACEYYPQFFNDIFCYLFLDQSLPNIVNI